MTTEQLLQILEDFGDRILRSRDEANLEMVKKLQSDFVSFWDERQEEIQVLLTPECIQYINEKIEGRKENLE
jgi:hypothetical protein